jgi:hypothetical protein
MGTSFFHESHFQGLLERVRERGRANVAQRVADQVSRLFHQSDISDSCHSQLICNNSHEDNKFGNRVSDSVGSTVVSSGKHSEVGVAKKQGVVIQNMSEVNAREARGRQSGTKEVNSISVLECSGDRNSGSLSNPVVFVGDCNVMSVSAVNKGSGSSSSANKDSFPSRGFLLGENLVHLEQHVVTAANNHNLSNHHEPDNGLREIVKEQHGTATTKSSGGSGQRNSGNYNNKLHTQTDERGGGIVSNTAKHNGCYGSPVTATATSLKGRHAMFANSPVPVAASPEPHNSRQLSDVAGGPVGAQGSSPLSLSLVSNSHVCVKLCSLIKAQLVKAHGEVTRRFGGNQGLMTLSDAFNTRSPIDNGCHKVENEADEEQCKIDVPIDRKRGKETLVPAETNKPERAWDSPEVRHSEAKEIKLQPSSVAASTTTELPLLSEKVKDGLMDMLHAISRLGGGQALPSQNQPTVTSVQCPDAVENEEVLAVSTTVDEKEEQGKADHVQDAGEEVTAGYCGEGRI